MQDRFPNDVDDVVSEVFIAIWRGLPSVRDVEKLKSWVSGITRNHVFQIYRHYYREITKRDKLEAEKDTEHQDSPLEQSYMGRELIDLYKAAKAEALTGEERIFLNLCLNEEISTREIADFFGIREDAVRKRLQRIKEKLQKWAKSKRGDDIDHGKARP